MVELTKYEDFSLEAWNSFDAFHPAVLSNFFIILTNPVLFNTYKSNADLIRPWPGQEHVANIITKCYLPCSFSASPCCGKTRRSQP